jgi:tetratricopeptide (TPR) repeat protein/DNA-binding transcriptional ArsR family regulator
VNEDEVSPPVTRAPATTLLYYLSTLEREVLTSPFVLLLDDFHWADQDSVQALKFLSRNIRNLPVLMAVALREDEVDDPAFIEVLRDLRREGLVTDIHLKGLNETAARQLLESVAQAHVDPAKTRAALRSLIERTGGNPYFLVETVHQLQEGGQIRKEGGKAMLDLAKLADGESAALPVPGSISDLLKKRLEALSGDEREMLEMASLVGKEFKAAPLKDLVRPANDGTDRVLQRLATERGLLFKENGDEPRYSFAHALLWETVRNAIPSPKKGELSKKLASWWEAHEPGDVEKIAALYREGGVATKGLHWTEKSIAISLQAHAHQRVARHFEFGLGLLRMNGAPAKKEVEWGLSVVDQLRRDGAEAQLVEPMCRVLMELNPPEPLLCNVMLELLNVTVNREPQARQLLSKIQRSVELKPEIASPATTGRIAVLEALILTNEGQIEAANDKAGKASSLLSEGDTYFQGLVHHHLGWIATERANWEEAERHIELALKSAKSGNAGGLIPRILNLQGAMAIMKGELVKAEETFTEFVEITRNKGQFHGLVVGLCNLGIALARRGNFAKAEEAIREELRIAEKFDYPLDIGTGSQLLGYLRLHMGLPEEAIEFFRTAESVYLEHAISIDRMGLRSDMAEARGLAGDPVGALQDLAEVEEEDRVDQTAMLGIRRATLLLATGARDEAKAEVDRALALCRQHGLRYWEGRALLVLADWEERFGSSGKATDAREEADKVLKECGVCEPSLAASPAPEAPAKVAVEEADDKEWPHLSLSILRFLADHGGLEDAIRSDDVAPLALTQKGISDGLGIPRDRFSTTLKRLSNRGIVTVRTQYIRGQTRQMKVYLLTRAGAEVINR